MKAVQITAVLDEHFIKEFRSVRAAAQWMCCSEVAVYRALKSRSNIVAARYGTPFYVKRIPAAEYREEIPEEWRY